MRSEFAVVVVVEQKGKSKLSRGDLFLPDSSSSIS